MPSATLQYEQYRARLTQIDMSIAFALSAVRDKEQRLGQDPQLTEGFEKIKKGIYHMTKALDPEAKTDKVESFVEKTSEEFRETIMSWTAASELLLNLGHVMLCTQLELFINHLVDVVLRTEPRKFLDLFPEKELKAKEIIQVQDYATVVQLLRDKVIDQIDRAGTRDKVVKYLGSKFGLINATEIKFTPPTARNSSGFKEWNMDKLEEIFDQRHHIVHRGALPLKDLGYLNDVCRFFVVIQTILTVNAVRKYSVELDPLSKVTLQLRHERHG